MINEILPLNNHIWAEKIASFPNTKQQELLQQIYAEIITANLTLNLTRITEPNDFWEKHIWDSLIPVLALNLTDQNVIDVGSGAGFPGLPVAIANRNIRVTLLDSTAKKINFLTQLKSKLNITNIDTLLGRVETIGRDKNHREKYDLALIRAVAEITVCAEYVLPLIKVGGIAILYRGNVTLEELEKLENMVTKLGGIIDKKESFTTPLTQGIRNCIYLKKITNTPFKFPRLVGEAKKNPL